MRKSLSPYLRTVFSVLLVALFALVVYGQDRPVVRESETETFVKVAGWVLLSGAAIAHIVSNIWTVLKGKNYEQLKEAVSNYKELADSRRAQLAEVKAELEEVRLENEKLTEKILRS